MQALPLMVGALCVLAIAYRYYSAFIATKVLVLDAARRTPAHTAYDGQNFHPTNRFVLFGHHFAAISGAGPLIGPVLAMQFGYAPSLLWLLIGVVIGGAVHDFVILTASMRRGGRSLAEIARTEIGPVSGFIAAIAILFIVIIALAGLGLAVVNALAESSWGTFTIGMSIPIALGMGLWMYRIRPGAIRSTTAVGVVLLLSAVVAGGEIPNTALGSALALSRTQITLAMGAYGLIASILPVWLLLCPRDYLSSYMKLGTIAFLVLGIVIVNPVLLAPPVSEFASGGGPIVPGKLYPFVFITIACGAISGFHGLVGSGTTPKMINVETDARAIGYGAMLLECLVGITALIAAGALHPADYYAINLSPAKFAAMGLQPVHLTELAAQVGEDVAGRPGGAVSLALGMAQIFSGLPGMSSLMKYWYHFAIMFEALFILTTIDTGTRVARFLVQEAAGKVWAPLARTDWLPGTVMASLAVVAAWVYFILTGSIATLWPMFGIANQLLASVGLVVGTTVLINEGKGRYAWITLVPLAWVATTSLTAGYQSIRDNFLPLARTPDKAFQGLLNAGVTAVLMVSVVVIVADALRRWMAPRRSSAEPATGEAAA